MDKDKINLGRKITKTFQGGIYEEVMHLRKAIWALYVLQNTELFSADELETANIIIAESLELNAKIEEMNP